VLTLPVAGELNARLRQGAEVTEIESDTRGNDVLRSFKRLAVPGLNWWLVAEIEVREALAPVNTLRMRILGFGLLIAAAFLFAARRLAKSVTRPVLALAESARRLGGRDFAARVSVESADEIGELAASFNRMAEQLEQTTVSKGQVDRTLSALINAVFVIEASPGAAPEELLESRIVSANPAALELLGYTREELIGAPFSRIVTAEEARWRSWLEQLLERGRLPAVEASLTPKGGAPIAVLFTAALTAREPGAPAGVVCAAQDITERKRAEAEIRQKQQELEHLTERLITAQEDERRRLARELHDDATQRLAALAIEAGKLARLSGEEARAGIDRIKQELIRVSDEVHGFSRRLHPATLDDLGLAAAIESACRGFFEQGGAPVEVSFEGAVDGLPPNVQLAIYRIVQEALANIRRHAAADQVSIRVAAPDGQPAVLEIQDNGRGFRRDDPGWRPGLGLASMEERARLLGGRFTVDSEPGRGTRIQVTVPTKARDEIATSTPG
jgi:PAS domain S-box-containing protein